MPNMPESAITLPQDRHLTLVVPGLAPAAADGQISGDLQRLEWLLGRADKSVDPLAGSADASLFQLFGVEIKSGQDVPVAAVTRVLDMGVVDNAWWMRADPVHLAPHDDTLILSGGEGLAISQEEADQMVVEILDVFLADGWVLKAPRPDRWYLQLVDVPDMQTTPVANVAGRDIRPALPTGKDGKQWHTILNELQIMLHTSAVNVEREAKGLPAINGLWLWGGGRLPTMKENNWVKYWGQDTAGTALARLSEVAHVGRPASGENWLREADAGKHLVMLDQASQARLGGHAEALQDFMDTFDEQWAEPLINALRTNELQDLIIVLDGGISFKADAKGLGRWWRRRARIGSLGRA